MIKKLLIFTRGLVIALFHDMHQGDITLRAMGLVYTTLLSLVPLLALSFSVLKGFGVHNQMEPLLLALLEPMGDKAEELTHQVLDFVDNVQVGVLGVAGLAMLFYTVVSLIVSCARFSATLTNQTIARIHAWRSGRSFRR